MRILCRFTNLLKLALLALLAGIALGFWAGQHVAAPMRTPVPTSLAPFPETPGLVTREGVNSNGATHPPDRGVPRLAVRPAGLTAGAPRSAPRKLLPSPHPVIRMRGRA
jgi:hypothetical protein